MVASSGWRVKDFSKSVTSGHADRAGFQRAPVRIIEEKKFARSLHPLDLCNRNSSARANRWKAQMQVEAGD